MRKYGKQLAVILGQALLFYLFPPLSKPMGPLAAVFVMAAATFALAVIMGSRTAGRSKWAYPVFAAVLFAPSVFLYYNESALVHTFWYLVISFIGVSIGAWEQHASGK